ncbi:MAG: TolC family protein [Sphingobacteriaceae bacterium]|jgi:outer membrane protein TolC|nr:TolC family protein [Sphingobacteriaceae bacterium]
MSKTFFIVLLSVLSFAKASHAQDSMIPDVSYLFIEKLIATAKENYPRVKSYAERTKIAKGNVTKQQLSWLDPLSFSYFYQPNTALNIVTPNIFSGYQIGLNLNVGTLLRKPLDIKESKQEVKIAENDEAEYNGLIEQEVKSRYFAYIQQLSMVKLYTKSLQDAQGLLASTKNKFERGETTVDVYSQMLMSVNTTTQAKISAEAGLLTAKASLEELLFKKLEEVK